MVTIIVRFMVQSFFQRRGTTRRGSKHLGERCIYCNNKSWIGNTWAEHELKSWILAFLHEQGLPVELWISMIRRNFCIYFNLFSLVNFLKYAWLIDRIVVCLAAFVFKNSFFDLIGEKRAATYHLHTNALSAAKKIVPFLL